MSLPELWVSLQNSWISQVISGTTWGYPIVSALHVLAFALIGGAALIPFLREDGRWIRRVGLALVVLTGVLLFAAGAGRYYESTSFRIKMVLLALLAANAFATRQDRLRLHSAISIALWVAVIFAARGIAFF
jgi:hypothetical protein